MPHIQQYVIDAYVHMGIYCIFIAHIELLLHSVCIFEHLQLNLVAVCLLSDSDNDPIDPPLTWSDV
jgi:nitrate reductase gamma subunit